MRIPTDFTTDQRDETIVQILTDAIIFERIYNGMQETLKAANPDCEDWDPVSFYNGFANVWIFLVIYELPDEVEESLKDELSEVFYMRFNADLAKPFKDRERAVYLAEKIYSDWKFCIDRTDSQLKTA
ncbi:hypothetical protein RM545_06490 [Zunongwangia sp. F260]|uniref:Uncharacterized protein n=1 Tax=Autumnicola lenta TaxID=3075593 RepID=A0ABU3CJC1_9FLAO|nr:hypothetical protein [Zunongwangia sp. F260]MDT0646333.1 hypothetical protein [Zunongwangia sp. F260]